MGTWDVLQLKVKDVIGLRPKENYERHVSRTKENEERAYLFSHNGNVLKGYGDY